MTIRRTHRFTKKRSNLIREHVHATALQIIFVYSRYENGRRNFHSFLEKRILFTLKQNNFDISLITSKYYRSFLRNDKVKQITTILSNRVSEIKFLSRFPTNSYGECHNDRLIENKNFYLSNREKSYIEIINRLQSKS